MVSIVFMMYVNNLACVRVKGCESECFRINSDERHGCIMSHWVFNVYMGAVIKEVKIWMRRREGRFQEEGREGRLPVLRGRPEGDDGTFW